MQFTLYHMGHCPYCKKVIATIKALNLTVTYKDLDVHNKLRNELKNGGGKIQVPCLLINKKGKASQWMYESQDIIDHLKNL